MDTKRSVHELAKINADRILQPATSIVDLLDNGPRIVTKGEGLYITDQDGNTQLDGIAGLWCVNVGYGRKELAQAMAQAAEELSYYHTFSSASNCPQIELADKLLQMTPKNLTKVFYGCSGTDANDTLVKTAWQYFYLRGKPEKRKVIARQQAYHGTSISASSFTGLASYHKGFGLPYEGIIRVACPHYWRFCEKDQSEDDYCDQLIKEIADAIEQEGADTIAAFIAEPIMAAGGVVPPPKGYFEKLQPLLKAHDILFIADEVVCGYGRLGVNFGSDLYNLTPDMMASAKGITSGYFPLSAAYITQEIWDVLVEGAKQFGTFGHGYTYSGHPVGCATALANFALIEKENLQHNAADVGAYMHEQLKARLLPHKNVGEIRGHGLLGAVQLVKDKEQREFFDPSIKMPAKLTAACYKRGVIVRPLPSIGAIALSPPLIIEKKDIDFIIDTIEQGLTELFN